MAESVSSASGSEREECGTAGNVQFRRKFSVADYSDLLGKSAPKATAPATSAGA